MIKPDDKSISQRKIRMNSFFFVEFINSFKLRADLSPDNKYKHFTICIILLLSNVKREYREVLFKLKIFFPFNFLASSKSPS